MKGWYEKRKYIPAIGRTVAPEHRVAALKGGLHGKKRTRYASKKITYRSDADKDGVPDVKDCSPYDKTQQDILKKIRENRARIRKVQEMKREARYNSEMERLKREKERLEAKTAKMEKLAKEREEIAKLQARLKKASSEIEKHTLSGKIKARARKASQQLGKEAQKALYGKPKRKTTKRKTASKKKTTKRKTKKR